MPPTRLTESGRALYRVFVLPGPVQRSPHAPQRVVPLCPSRNQAQGRTYYRGKRDDAAPVKEVTPFNDPKRPLDEAIQARFVHIVSPDGSLVRDETLRHLLYTIDRKEQHIREVTRDDDGTPIVKIFTKSELYGEARAEAKTKVKQAKSSKRNDLKQLELNWAIDAKNDLNHRLKRLEDFLTEGKSVQVLLGGKKRGRRATREEMDNLLERIRETVQGVPGARESRQMDGAIGGQAVLRFVNKEAGADEDDTIMGVDEKKAKKEQEKKEWKAELEDRKRRREERAQQRQEITQ